MLGMATWTMVRSRSVMKSPSASTASASQGEDDRRACDIVVILLEIDRTTPPAPAGPLQECWLYSGLRALEHQVLRDRLEEHDLRRSARNTSPEVVVCHTRSPPR